MAVEKKSNGKILWKVMASSYHMVQKTFIKANFTNNMRTG